MLTFPLYYCSRSFFAFFCDFNLRETIQDDSYSFDYIKKDLVFHKLETIRVDKISFLSKFETLKS